MGVLSRRFKPRASEPTFLWLVAIVGELCRPIVAEGPALRSALRQLRRQLAASKGRGGQGRRRTLQAQIERLAVWLQGQAAAAEDEASGGGSGDNQGGDGPDGEFSAFFPLLNLWSYS